MFCPKCGNKLRDDAQFCGKCGNKINPAKRAAAQAAQANNARPTAAPAAATVHAGASPAAEKKGLGGAGTVGLIFLILALCTSLMTWFEPSSLLRGASGLGAMFGVATDFSETYGLWQFPMLIAPMSDYGSSGAFTAYVMLVPFVLWLIALILVIVSIVNISKGLRPKGKMVTAGLLLLLAAVFYIFLWFTVLEPNGLYRLHGYGEIAPMSSWLCALLGFVGMCCAAGTRKN